MSTGGRVFPSVTGGGLSRGAEAFVAGRARRRAEALQDRQISNSERITSLNAFTTLVPFLEVGTRLGDTDRATQELFAQAFEVDPAEFQNLDLNKETVDTLVDRLTLEGFTGLTNEEIASTEVVRARQGLEPIQEVADVTRDRASLTIEAFKRIRNEPARLDDFVARVEGLDPITVVFPGDRPDMTFDRVEAASLYVSLLRDQDVATARFDALGAEQRKEVIDEIRDAVRQREFEVGSTAVSNVLDIYDSAIDARDGTIIDRFLASNVTEGEKLAMQVVAGSIAFGDEFLFEGFPPELRKLMQTSAIVEALQDADPEQVQELTDQLRESEFGSFKEGPFGFGRPRFQLSSTTVAEEAGGGIDPAAASLEVQTLGVMDVLGQELPEGQTEEQRRARLVTQVGEAVVVAAEGRNAEADAEDPPEAEAALSAAQSQIVTSQQRQLVLLQARRASVIERTRGTPDETNPIGPTQFAIRSIDARIATLEREIAIDSTALPFEKVGTDEVPKGGLDPAAMPQSVRNKVTRLNTMLRRIESSQGQSFVRGLESAVANLIREIRADVGTR